MTTEQLKDIRQRLRAHKITQREIALMTGHHVSWISTQLRGNYPTYYAHEKGRADLTRELWRYLLQRNVVTREEFGLCFD